MNQSDSIVIIPTYNEKENIEKIIRAVFALEKCFHILIIDDGSPDGTAAIVHHLMDTEFADRLFIVERSGNWDWELPISPVSNGHWNVPMNMCLKWMLTSVTILTTCLASMQHVPMKDTMWLSAVVTSAVSTWSTGPSAVC